MRKIALMFTVAGALALVACQDRSRQQNEPGVGGSGMQDQTNLPGEDKGNWQRAPDDQGGTGGTGSEEIEQREMQQPGGQENMGGSEDREMMQPQEGGQH